MSSACASFAWQDWQKYMRGSQGFSQVRHRASSSNFSNVDCFCVMVFEFYGGQGTLTDKPCTSRRMSAFYFYLVRVFISFLWHIRNTGRNGHRASQPYTILPRCISCSLDQRNTLLFHNQFLSCFFSTSLFGIHFRLLGVSLPNVQTQLAMLSKFVATSSTSCRNSMRSSSSKICGERRTMLANWHFILSEDFFISLKNCLVIATSIKVQRNTPHPAGHRYAN